jgi:hypothetical protein
MSSPSLRIAMQQSIDDLDIAIREAEANIKRMRGIRAQLMVQQHGANKSPLCACNKPIGLLRALHGETMCPRCTALNAIPAAKPSPGRPSGTAVARMACQAIQYSDQMICGWCNISYDVNDPDPPQCGLHKGQKARSSGGPAE